MNWYVVDKKYINYLTQFDSRVGYVEYGNRLKLMWAFFLRSERFITMFPYLLQSQNTSKCPIVWIFTSYKTNPMVIFMRCLISTI